jgi:hypothetical protein
MRRHSRRLFAVLSLGDWNGWIGLDNIQSAVRVAQYAARAVMRPMEEVGRTAETDSARPKSVRPTAAKLRRQRRAHRQGRRKLKKKRGVRRRGKGRRSRRAAAKIARSSAEQILPSRSPSPRALPELCDWRECCGVRRRGVFVAGPLKVEKHLLEVERRRQLRNRMLVEEPAERARLVGAYGGAGTSSISIFPELRRPVLWRHGMNREVRGRKCGCAEPGPFFDGNCGRCGYPARSDIR